MVHELSQEKGIWAFSSSKNNRLFDTQIIPRALCVVDTFFTEKNLLNALLIGVTFFFYYKKWFQTLKKTILKGLFNCVVIASVIYNFINGFLVP